MPNNRTRIGLRSSTRGLIYEDLHDSYREAVENALLCNIDLSGLDASGENLQGVNLDGAALTNVNFKGSNLTGANLSEASFRDCIFDGTSLFDACFCYSDLIGCSFQDSRFGMTDMAEASITECFFSGVATFNLNLAKSYSFTDNAYFHGKIRLEMTHIPFVVHSSKGLFVFFDRQALINGDTYDIRADSPVG